jgi:hypothetical protein
MKLWHVIPSHDEGGRELDPHDEAGAREGRASDIKLKLCPLPSMPFSYTQLTPSLQPTLS